MTTTIIRTAIGVVTRMMTTKTTNTTATVTENAAVRRQQAGNTAAGLIGRLRNCNLCYSNVYPLATLPHDQRFGLSHTG